MQSSAVTIILHRLIIVLYVEKHSLHFDGYRPIANDITDLQ